MPKKCIICKAEPNPFSKRSFHMFPSNESVRQTWLDTIHLSKTPNFKTAYICSDHFHKESFFYSDESRKRKRLPRDAIPKKRSISPLKENVSETSVSNSMNNCKVSAVKTNDETEMCTDEVTCTNALYSEKRKECKDINFQSCPDEEAKMYVDKMSLTISLGPEESDVLNDISFQSNRDKETIMYTDKVPLNNFLNRDCDACDTRTVNNSSSNNEFNKDYDQTPLNNSSDDCHTVTVNNSTSNSELNSKKRKRSFADLRPAKRVRFMNGFQTEYVCREDFISEEAWERFLRYSAYEKSKTASAHNRNSRKQKKKSKI